MLYLAGLLFLLLFPLQPLGVVWITVTALLVAAAYFSRRRTPALNSKDAMFLVYAALAVIPVLAHGENPTFFIRLVLYPWLISLVFQNLSFDERRVEICFWVLTGVALAVSGVMLFQYAPGKFDFSLQQLFSLNRNVGLYYLQDTRIGANTAAAMSAAAVILILSHLKFVARPRMAAYPLLGVAMAFLIVAGGRNAWLSTFACVLLFFVYARPLGPRGRGRAILRFAAITAVIVAGAAVTLNGVGSGAHGDRLVERIQGILSPADDETVQVRLVYWARASTMLRQQPLGSGFNAYYSRYNRTPHNEVLGQLVAVGWLGAVTYFVLIGAVWLHVLRMRRGNRLADRLRFASLCLLLVFTLAMVTENVSRGSMNTYSPLLWVVLGISYGVQRRSATAAVAAPAPRRRRLVRPVRAEAPQPG